MTVLKKIFNIIKIILYISVAAFSSLSAIFALMSPEKDYILAAFFAAIGIVSVVCVIFKIKLVPVLYAAIFMLYFSVDAIIQRDINTAVFCLVTALLLVFAVVLFNKMFSYKKNMKFSRLCLSDFSEYKIAILFGLFLFAVSLLCGGGGPAAVILIGYTTYVGVNVFKDKLTDARVSEACAGGKKTKSEQIFLLNEFSKDKTDRQFHNIKVVIAIIFSALCLFSLWRVEHASNPSSSESIIAIIVLLSIGIVCYVFIFRKFLKKTKEIDEYFNAVCNGCYTKQIVPISTTCDHIDDNEGGSDLYYVNVGGSNFFVYQHIYSACQSAEHGLIFRVLDKTIYAVKKSYGFVKVTSCIPERANKKTT